MKGGGNSIRRKTGLEHMVSPVAPTKPRIKAFLLNQGLLSPFYPVKTVIGIGIGLTLCGVILTIFGSVAYLIEASMASLCSGIWIGLLVMSAGLLAVFSGTRPHSSLLLHTNLFVSIVTVAFTGFMTILTANSVLKDGEIETLTINESIVKGVDRVDITLGRSPAFMVNSLLLAVSSLTAILSFANFVLTGREACQCYSAATGSLDAQINIGVDTMQRRDRIIAWILQTSSQDATLVVSDQPSPVPTPTPFGPNKSSLVYKVSNASSYYHNLKFPPLPPIPPPGTGGNDDYGKKIMGSRGHLAHQVPNPHPYLQEQHTYSLPSLPMKGNLTKGHLASFSYHSHQSSHKHPNHHHHHIHHVPSFAFSSSSRVPFVMNPRSDSPTPSSYHIYHSPHSLKQSQRKKFFKSTASTASTRLSAYEV